MLLKHSNNFHHSTVHGFANASYAVVEDKRLDTTFSLNVKGETNLPLMISGAITSEADTASECLLDLPLPLSCMCGRLFSITLCHIDWNPCNSILV